MYWVRNSDIEVSGLGKVILDKEKQTFTVVSAMLLPQKGTATTTQIEAKDIAKAMFETKDSEGVLAFWWHSHVKMQAFWSGTDTKTIEDTADGGLCVATVFNHQGDTKTAVAFKCEGPLGTTIVRYDDVTMEVPQREKTAEELVWQGLLDTCVPKQVATVAHSHTSTWYYDSKLGRMVQKVPKQMGFLGDKEQFTQDGDPVTNFDRWKNEYNGRDEAEAGITGIGIEAEAKMLGISVKALRKAILKGENNKQYQQYEARLYNDHTIYP